MTKPPTVLTITLLPVGTTFIPDNIILVRTWLVAALRTPCEARHCPGSPGPSAGLTSASAGHSPAPVRRWSAGETAKLERRGGRAKKALETIALQDALHPKSSFASRDHAAPRHKHARLISPRPPDRLPMRDRILCPSHPSPSSPRRRCRQPRRRLCGTDARSNIAARVDFAPRGVARPKEPRWAGLQGMRSAVREYG